MRRDLEYYPIAEDLMGQLAPSYKDPGEDLQLRRHFALVTLSSAGLGDLESNYEVGVIVDQYVRSEIGIDEMQRLILEMAKSIDRE